MRLLLTALPLRGHVHPMVPLALACRDAGHDVRFRVPGGYVGRLDARRLAEVGVAVVDPVSIGDTVHRLLAPDAPERHAASALRDELRAMPAPADVVPVLEAIARN